MSLEKLDRVLTRTAKLDPVKAVFCLLVTESVLILTLKQIFIQAINYGVFLYEIYAIILRTLEEGRAVQFPKADFTLHPHVKKNQQPRRSSDCFHGMTSYRADVSLVQGVICCRLFYLTRTTHVWTGGLLESWCLRCSLEWFVFYVILFSTRKTLKSNIE